MRSHKKAKSARERERKDEKSEQKSLVSNDSIGGKFEARKSFRRERIFQFVQEENKSEQNRE